jgi:tetratricopeptide (TPR) repeat protein
MEIKFATYAHQPNTIDSLALEKIEAWANNNPSSMNIWMIYCKKLMQLNHPKFKDVLRKVSFYSPNRVQLHHYLYNAEWKLSNDILPTQPLATVISNKSIKDAILEKDLLANAVSSSILMDATEGIELFEKPIEEEVNHPIQTKPKESESTAEELDFITWIKSDTTKLTVVKAPSLASKTIVDSAPEIHPTVIEKNLELDTPKGAKFTKKLSREEIIQRFVTLEPKITPKKVEMYNSVNMAKKSTVEDFDHVTETLAKIYVSQSQYDKAKKAYQSLSLRIPEKKSYFADQLKKIEALIHQKKNK